MDWDTEQAFIMPNTAPSVGGKANPLNNVHARMALAYATNATQVAKEIGTGVQVPTSPWSPEQPVGHARPRRTATSATTWPRPRPRWPSTTQTPARAALTFTLSGLPSVDDARTLQQLQGQWKQAGINVNIETLEQTAYITKIATGGYQAAFFRNYGYPDPDQDYYFWSSTTAKGVGNISINFTQYTTPAIEKDLTTGRQSGYPKIRKTAYNDLTKQLNAAFTNIWLYSHALQLHRPEEGDGPRLARRTVHHRLRQLRARRPGGRTSGSRADPGSRPARIDPPVGTGPVT